MPRWRRCRTLPHDSAADGMTEDDADEIRRWGEPPKLAEPKEHRDRALRARARGEGLGLAFGFLVGDTALVALALYRFALDRLVREGLRPSFRRCWFARRPMYGTGFFPSDKSDYYEIAADGLYLVGTSEVPLIAMHMDEILEQLPLRTARSRRVSGGRRARPDATRAGCSACTSSRRSRWSCTRAGSLVGRARADARDRGVAGAGARNPVPRRQHRGGRPLGCGGEAIRHRGLVPVAGALPRADVVLEHDRLPGAPFEDPLSHGRQGARDAAHAQRDGGH